jgi:hypothetical protein
MNRRQLLQLTGLLAAAGAVIVAGNVRRPAAK